MSQLFSQLSNDIAAAVDRASAAVVQIHGHRRPIAGVVFTDDLVAAPARALGDDTVTVRTASGSTHEGAVLGHALSMGLGVVRVKGLGVTPLAAGDEPKVGHLAIAIGRTWSGGVMATVTNVAVVGGPLRTGRSSSDRTRHSHRAVAARRPERRRARRRRRPRAWPHHRIGDSWDHHRPAGSAGFCRGARRRRARRHQAGLRRHRHDDGRTAGAAA